MKVTLGPYKNAWFGPYQLADLLQYVGVSEDKCFEIGDRLSKTWVNSFCEFVYKHNPLAKRKIKIKIDTWDSWSMDHTLALIALPMLKQLRVDKHSSSFVDDCDVPDEIKSMNAPRVTDEWDLDDYFHKRWDYVLDQMIFSFDSKVNDDWEAQFRSGESDYVDVELDELFDGEKIYSSEHGPNHTLVYDWDGMKKYQARIDNGFRLFGKYYQNLWS